MFPEDTKLVVVDPPVGKAPETLVEVVTEWPIGEPPETLLEVITDWSETAKKELCPLLERQHYTGRESI